MNDEILSREQIFRRIGFGEFGMSFSHFTGNFRTSGATFADTAENNISVSSPPRPIIPDPPLAQQEIDVVNDTDVTTPPTLTTAPTLTDPTPTPTPPHPHSNTYTTNNTTTNGNNCCNHSDHCNNRDDRGSRWRWWRRSYARDASGSRCFHLQPTPRQSLRVFPQTERSHSRCWSSTCTQSNRW